MTIIRELYLYLTKVTVNVKTPGKITSLYILGDVTIDDVAISPIFFVNADAYFG